MSLAAAVYLFGEGDIHQRKSTWSPRGFHAGKIRSGAASFSLLVGWIGGCMGQKMETQHGLSLKKDSASYRL